MEGTHKNLIVWQESINLAKQIHKICVTFPQYETFGLADQMRRPTASIPSNIAEGYGRGTEKEITHFLHIAMGSANELDTQLILAKEFGYISNETYEQLLSTLEPIIKMLRSLISKRCNTPKT